TRTAGPSSVSSRSTPSPGNPTASTRAPASRHARTPARPMPLVPPTTTTTLPSSAAGRTRRSEALPPPGRGHGPRGGMSRRHEGQLDVAARLLRARLHRPALLDVGDVAVVERERRRLHRVEPDETVAGGKEHRTPVARLEA